MKKFFVGLVILGLMTSCSSKQSAPSDDVEVSDVRDKSFKAEVNESTSQVQLPIDDFLFTDDELRESDSAVLLELSLCMNSEGYPASWSPAETGIEREWYRYGRWNKDYAAKLGYTDISSVEGSSPALISEQKFLKEFAEVVNSAEYDKAQTKCSSTNSEVRSVMRTMKELSEELVQMREQSYFLMMETDDAQQILAEWEECLKVSGLERDESVSPFAIKGVSHDVADEDSIKAALADVKCKEEVHFIQRLADIEASFQGPLVQKYQSELVAAQEEIDETITSNREYLKLNAAKGEALWKP
ncbi:hypothetical protein [Jonesia quinghaiensis]|uniref:hypothetical protein n=1 Tax=Jonesia quinghaiensis TaxID=262806 RepID=UPI00049156CC|nr:hypothetical protein [Jonesia quinghaiensis]